MIYVSVTDAHPLIGLHFEEYLFRNLYAKSNKNGSKVVDVLLMKAGIIVIQIRIDGSIFFALSNYSAKDIVERTIVTKGDRDH